jgi:hypothetical protein
VAHCVVLFGSIKSGVKLGKLLSADQHTRIYTALLLDRALALLLILQAAQTFHAGTARPAAITWVWGCRWLAPPLCHTTSFLGDRQGMATLGGFRRSDRFSGWLLSHWR